MGACLPRPLSLPPRRYNTRVTHILSPASRKFSLPRALVWRHEPSAGGNRDLAGQRYWPASRQEALTAGRARVPASPGNRPHSAGAAERACWNGSGRQYRMRNEANRPSRRSGGITATKADMKNTANMIHALYH